MRKIDKARKMKWLLGLELQARRVTAEETEGSKSRRGRVEESRFPQERGAHLDTGAQIPWTTQDLSDLARSL